MEGAQLSKAVTPDRLGDNPHLLKEPEHREAQAADGRLRPLRLLKASLLLSSRFRLKGGGWEDHIVEAQIFKDPLQGYSALPGTLSDLRMHQQLSSHIEILAALTREEEA